MEPASSMDFNREARAHTLASHPLCGGAMYDFPVKDFWNRIYRSNGCWLWIGHKDSYGYARVGRKLVHRYAYEALHEIELPRKIHLHHECETPACVNPFHLRPVTAQEHPLISNSVFRYYAERTHCFYGHEFTPENTFYRKDGGQRRCRECNRFNAKVGYYRRKAMEYFAA